MIRDLDNRQTTLTIADSNGNKLSFTFNQTPLKSVEIDAQNNNFDWIQFYPNKEHCKLIADFFNHIVRDENDTL